MDATTIQQLINGVSLGAIYALIALGYTMVFGVLRFINFAHGDLFMIGGYAGILLITGQSGELVQAISGQELPSLMWFFIWFRKYFLMGLAVLAALDLTIWSLRGRKAKLWLSNPLLLLPIITMGLLLFLPVFGAATFGSGDSAPIDADAGFLASVLPSARLYFGIFLGVLLVGDIANRATRGKGTRSWILRPWVLWPVMLLAAMIYLPWVGAYFFGPTNGQLPHTGWALFLLLGAMLVCASLGMTVEQFCYRPLRSQPKITVLITAIGVSLLLESLAQFGFGTDSQRLPPVVNVNAIEWTNPWVITAFGKQLCSIPVHPFLLDATGKGADLSILRGDVMVVVTTIVLLIILIGIVKFTKIGMAMRALAFNPTACSLMGVNVNFVIAFTFGLGSALAGAAGILISSTQSASALIGVNYGLKAFVAAVVGGIGNLTGAVLGGLLLGVVENYVASTAYGGYRDAVSFGLLIFILLVRPAGLLGKNVREKV